MRTRDEAAFAFLAARVLEPGERLAWTGRPTPDAAARAAGGSDPFATLLVVGVVLWLGGRALMAGEPLLLLVLMLLVGLWVVST
ncbi:MAG: hypothetical protein ACOCYE_12515, partial [Pseudomonadota bacterium]